MSRSRSEEQALYMAEMQAELEEQDKAELRDRVASNYELDKIIKSSKMSRRFLESDVGRFVQERAIEESEGAVNKLKALKMEDCNSKDHFIDEVKELQHAAHIPALVMTWLARAIQLAEEELKTINQEE